MDIVFVLLFVLPSLIEEYNEDGIITETGNTMSSWHMNNEREQIIDECIECFVHEYLQNDHQ